MQSTWGIPRIRATFLRTPVVRIMQIPVFGGLCWHPLIHGNHKLNELGEACKELQEATYRTSWVVIAETFLDNI